ncbi:hypothetical protein AB5I41_27160 [Sphingomonas sp. MMS24-JH45]
MASLNLVNGFAIDYKASEHLCVSRSVAARRAMQSGDQDDVGDPRLRLLFRTECR